MEHVGKKSEETSITVVVRFKEEKDAANESEWIIDEQDGSVSINLQNKGQKSFKFDGASSQMTQKQIYDNFAKSSIQKFLQGFNGTIFAYGQTCSGKTYTMLGPESVTESIVRDVHNIPSDVKVLFGIMPRSIFTIFDGINQGIKEGSQFSLKCSYIEIYNESIHDLLSSNCSVSLKLREHKFLGWVTEGLEEKYVKEPEEILQWLSLGTQNRAVAATKMNERSSRSHTVFILSLEQKLLDGSSRSSKLNLVDLAGSERLSSAQTTGINKEETKNINRSLYYLQYCIISLSEMSKSKKSQEEKDRLAGFRNSKLTKILKDALGGNSKTTLICAASMHQIHQADTMNTLYFAQRAKLIKNSINNNTKRSPQELEILLQTSQRSLMRSKRLIKDLMELIAGSDKSDLIESIQGIDDVMGNNNSSMISVETSKSKMFEEANEEEMIPEHDLSKIEEQNSVEVKCLEMEKHCKEVVRQTMEQMEQLQNQRKEELECFEEALRDNEISQKEIDKLNAIILQLQVENEQVYMDLAREKELREEKHKEDMQSLADRNGICELFTRKVDEYKKQVDQLGDQTRNLNEQLDNLKATNAKIQSQLDVTILEKERVEGFLTDKTQQLESLEKGGEKKEMNGISINVRNESSAHKDQKDEVNHVENQLDSHIVQDMATKNSEINGKVAIIAQDQSDQIVDSLKKQVQSLQEQLAVLEQNMKPIQSIIKTKQDKNYEGEEAPANEQIFQNGYCCYCGQPQYPNFMNMNQASDIAIPICDGSSIGQMFSAAMRKIQAERRVIAKNRSELDSKHQAIREAIEKQKRQIRNDLSTLVENEVIFERLEQHMQTYRSANDQLQTLRQSSQQRSEHAQRIVSHHRSFSRNMMSASNHIINSIVKIPKQYEMFSEPNRLKLQRKDYAGKTQSLYENPLLKENVADVLNKSDQDREDEDIDGDDEDDDGFDMATPIHFGSYDEINDSNLECAEDIANYTNNKNNTNKISKCFSENTIFRKFSTEGDNNNSSNECNGSVLKNKNGDNVRLTIQEEEQYNLSHKILYDKNQNSEKQLICSVQNSQVGSDTDEDSD